MMSKKQNDEAISGTSSTTGSISGVRFAISNDGGKTGVFWHDDVFRALDYLSLYDNVEHNYCVVVVKK